eukprot:31724-Pyramimonas_sp.AAC.1
MGRWRARAAASTSRRHARVHAALCARHLEGRSLRADVVRRLCSRGEGPICGARARAHVHGARKIVKPLA